jgi:uncharacterized protein
MKALLFLLALLALIGLIRASLSRRSKPPGTATPVNPGRQRTEQPQRMVQCAHCGVHLPESEAVTGRLGLYCSTEHRQAHEGA